MPRILRPRHLLFGALAYALALGSMAGFAAWQAELPLPFAIDHGAAGPRGHALVVDLALLLSFGVVHSSLARRRAKRVLARLVTPALERSAYTLVAALQMIALMTLWQPLPATAWSVEAPAARALLWTLQAGGWFLVTIGFAASGNTRLFGLAQAWASARDLPDPGGRLVARGVYRWIRHPLYSGTLLALWAIPTASEGRLLLALVFSAYILLGARFEERDLERDLGESYLEYRRAVPAYLPWPRPAPPARRPGALASAEECPRDAVR